MRDVAFCLVENEKGEVLFIQRAYGKEKGKWSLPGGLVDRGEGSRHAAYRETREETGVIVKITHRLFTGNTNPIKVFVGQRVGGRLRFQKKECLDVQWRNPERIRPEDLAFGGDRKALGCGRTSRAARPNRRGITRLKMDAAGPVARTSASGPRRWWSRTAGICWSETKARTNTPCPGAVWSRARRRSPPRAVSWAKSWV